MHWLIKSLLMLAALCATMWVTSVGAQAPPATSQRTIDVSGHGEVYAKPDSMTLSFAVDNEAPTIDECAGAHADKVRKLMDALKDKLGTETKIETADYSLNRNVTYVPIAVTAAAPEPPTGSWEFKADLTAKSDSVAIMGELIEAAMGAGATRLVESGVFDPEMTSGTSVYVGPPHSPRERKIFVTLEVEVYGQSATDASQKGVPLVASVKKALSEKLSEHGSVELSEFHITKTRLAPNGPGATPTPQMMSAQQQVHDFAAHTTITARTSKLDLLGAAVQAGLDNGATRLNQVQFTLQDDSKVRTDAIEKASDEAKTKAEVVAKAMGVKLGKIIRITTTGAVQPQTLSGRSFQGTPAASMHPEETAGFPFVPKEVGFSADVSVSYEIP